MEGDKSSEGRSIYADGSAMASNVSSGDGSNSNVATPTLDKKAFADQFEQRMQAKIDKEKEGDNSEGRSIYIDGSAMASAVSSGDGCNSNVPAPTLDKKAFADQFEQRMQAKVEKEKEGDNNNMTQDAPSPAKTHVMCAAGHHCMADPEIATDLTRSPHECLNCCEKMHDPSTCGEMFVDVEDIHGFAIPTHMLSENGQLKLREQVSASNLAICGVCIEKFRLPCLLTGAAVETSTQVAEGGLEEAVDICQNPIMRKLNVKVESVGDNDEAPRPLAYASAQYDERDAAVKQEVKNIPQMSPPVPPAAEAKMAAMVEDTDIEIKKKAFISPHGVGGNGSEPPILTPGAAQEHQSVLFGDLVQSDVPSAQAKQTAPIITRPPPRSMLPPNQQSTPSLAVIQATLVEEEPPAPVYDAIPLQPSEGQSLPWWKRRATLGMGCIIVVLAATVGALIGLLGNNNDRESATAGSTDTEGESDTSDVSKEITALDVFQPSQYPSQQRTAPSFPPSCFGYSYISTSPVQMGDSGRGKGIVFAIQSDVDDEDGLEIMSLGFHVNIYDLTGSNSNNNNKQAEGGFIEYEVYTLSDEDPNMSDDFNNLDPGYNLDPGRSEGFASLVADSTNNDFQPQMDQWELIAAGNITSIDNLTTEFTTMDSFVPDYFQIPYEVFTKTSVPGNGKVRSFYIATPRTTSFKYVDPPAGKLVNSETALSGGSVMEGEYIPKILTGKGVTTYPLKMGSAYQTKSFVGTVYWERECSPTRARDLVFDEIGARIAKITPGGIDTLMDPSTVHHRAFQWMVYEDGMELGPSKDHLHQRYCLMVIYFISGPWTPAEGGLEWGSPVHECEWEGIYCEDVEDLEDKLGGRLEELLEVGREDGIKIDVPQRIANRLELRQRLVSGKVPAEISLLYYLQHLGLENNKMIGALPMPLYELFNLQTLFLEQNELTNVVAIGEYRHLEHLALSKNNFQGPLADSFKNLKKLKTLYLHTNGFTGEVWDVLKTFEQMELLDISFNKFEGTIPSDIGSMKNLTSIFLGHNDFKGEIPKELSNCKNLKQLQIDGSHDIVGTIPTFLGQLSHMEFIKLDTCAFTGTLPMSLGNLKKLSFLDVNSNELDGRIPTQLGKATSLKTLGLANNDFSGEIPSELGKLTKLEKAYFQNTDIEGIMPDEVCALRNRGNENVLEVLFVPCDVECDAMCCTNCS